MGMGARGVSRPMAEQALDDTHDEAGDEAGHAAANEDTEHDDEPQGMGPEARRELLQAHHRQTLWVYWTLPLLGLWLLVSPWTLGYLNADAWVDPSGGRGPWFAERSTEELQALRAWLMTGSDVVSGALLLVFGWRSLRPDRPFSLWTCCCVGVWLTFAPVLFWAPTAASYLNASVVGILVIALTILVPGMPNMILYVQHGPATPPGWSYNPSSWPQRWIMIVTGFLGFVVSRYLATYQLGYTDFVWDPFFGFEQGTKRVLDSAMSHRWPVSDAGFGTLSYTFEFLMGYMGSPSRWRTMPWMVAFFGILVIPLGLTHILLVISQPVIVHAWCTFCLLAAAIMLPMIPLEVDEVVAMVQHVRRAKARGDRNGSLWAIFWKGGRADDCTPDERTPPLIDLPERPGALFRASIWGLSFPPTLVISTALGVALMACPALFGVDIRTTAADIGHLGGALVVTFSVIAMGEVLRLGRLLNVPLALGVAIGPWLVGAPTAFAITTTLLAGAILALAFPRGRVHESYGGWDAYVR